jgi:anti-anti-sigma factor
LKITQREVGDVVVLDLEGKLLGGPDQWDQLRNLFKTLVDSGKKNIIVNLEKINRVSSTGFGILIGRRKEVREIGGDLVLMQFQDQVKHPFYIMELNRLFKAFDNEEEALKNFTE